VGEDHRAEEADLRGESHGGLERQCLQDSDREEDEAERLRAGAVLACEEVGDEGLGDEPTAKTVEGE
jgi:hypothetical protein